MNAAKLTKTQFKTATIILALAVLAEDGEVSQYEARRAGAWTEALSALVDKGILVREYKSFVMPSGPYAGQTLQNQAFYSAGALA